MPGLRRLLDPHRRAAAHARARRAPGEHGVPVRHRLRRPLPVLHEHLRDALASTAGPRPSPPGLAMARPDLDVWVVSGDGDALSIGGNHLIHALRRNVNLTILLFNNQIYGLTKGQYSPTSEVGKVTKSTPFGSLDQPFNPLSLALGAEATFVARTHDMDRQHMMETFRRAHDHRGVGVRRDLPELQRLQRRRLRADHRQGGRAADMLIPLAPRRAHPLRRRRREGRGGRRAGPGLDRRRRRRGRGRAARPRRGPRRPVAGLRPVPPGRRARRCRRRSACSGPSSRRSTATSVDRQLAAAQERRGPGDLAALLASAGTWEVTGT